MPNVYKRRPGARKYADYNEAQLEKALAEVAQGHLSVRGAAEKYSIPKSTIFRKYRGQHHRKHGGQTVLSEADEQKVVEGLLLAAEWGFPKVLATKNIAQNQRNLPEVQQRHQKK